MTQRKTINNKQNDSIVFISEILLFLFGCHFNHKKPTLSLSFFINQILNSLHTAMIQIIYLSCLLTSCTMLSRNNPDITSFIFMQ